MENEDSLHGFLDTKSYDFVDLARHIVIHLNAMPSHADEDNKFLALNRQERIDNLMDLLKKCKGTLYAMWKTSLYEECLKDPHGMQICFIDSQRNNWQKKTEGRKHKLCDTEIEEQEAATGIHVKKRCLSSKTKPEVPLEELRMEYFDDARGVPLAPLVNLRRSSGAPKGILRGVKFRAIEAIRQANAEGEAADSATRGDRLEDLAAVGLDIPLPLTIALLRVLLYGLEDPSTYPRAYWSHR
ncbi:hypothetical protein L873DRAFT_1816347 [Choiromyces venosus 120613-1]|uniref:Uncharacterized protein n=1 Tax=Choiromyces venosus 120613-1 TaxID=1336337 RepID=A0A3N4J507_9PEZI|nr:hypothetical protein L873DRAFT_1816347 [Choiromyces venosus 120613-1]